MDIITIIGQVFGIIAVALGFLSFQMKEQKPLLIVQTATSLAFVIHYGLIGAYSGMLINFLAMFRNLAYYHKDKPLFSGWKCPIFFAILISLAGLLSWQGYYSIFVILGVGINTLCLAFTDTQKTRASILVSSPLVLIYDAFVMSIGGMIYESVVIISSIIGILRFRRKK